MEQPGSFGTRNCYGYAGRNNQKAAPDLSILYPGIPFCSILSAFYDGQWKYTNIWNIISNVSRSLWEMPLLPQSGLGAFSDEHIQFDGPLWFLSAFLLAILILYPLMRRFRYIFSMVIAPIIAFFGYGYLSVTIGNLNTYYTWTGICFSGILRAASGIRLGTMLYAAQAGKGIRKLSVLGDAFVTLTEVILLGIILAYTNSFYMTQYDFLMIPLIALLIYFAFCYD